MEQHAISSDLIRGHIDTIILHTLIDGDKYAQQISNVIDEKSEKKYQINQATLYSSLKRLETCNYVNSYWYDADGGRRKFFKLTENGKKYVEGNLSNWSYSRAIIDRLMDFEPETVVKIVKTPVYVQDQSSAAMLNDKKETYAEKPEQNAVTTTPEDVKSTDNNSPTTSEQVQKPVEKETYAVKEDAYEANFRTILSGLIKANAPAPQPVVIEKKTGTIIEPITVQEEKTEEKQSFYDTISDAEYQSKRDYNSEKIDFTELAASAAKEGFKIRVSSKESAVSVGRILINKTNFIASLITFVLCIVELLCVVFTCKSSVSFSPFLLTIMVLCLLVYPVMRGIILRKNPYNTVSDVSADGILVSFIVLFNVTLICFAGNLIFGGDFSETKTVLLTLALPVLLTLDVVLYYAFRFFLSKTEFCKIKKTK